MPRYVISSYNLPADEAPVDFLWHAGVFVRDLMINLCDVWLGRTAAVCRKIMSKGIIRYLMEESFMSPRSVGGLARCHAESFPHARYDSKNMLWDQRVELLVFASLERITSTAALNAVFQRLPASWMGRCVGEVTAAWRSPSLFWPLTLHCRLHHSPLVLFRLEQNRTENTGRK